MARLWLRHAAPVGKHDPVTHVPRHSPESFVIDVAQAQAFASACGGTYVPLTSQDAGTQVLAPPMAVAIGTLVQGVQPVLRKTLSPKLLGHVVHREETVTWHAPFYLQTPYRIVSALLQHEQRRAGGVVQVGVHLQDASGAVVVSSTSTLFVRPPNKPVTVAAAAAAVVPGAASADAAMLLESWTVASDQPERYAKASSEVNPIHLDDAVARAAGLPGRILHGMCTLAYSARVLTDHVVALQQARPGSHRQARQGAATAALTHLSARFARPVFPGDKLTCRATACLDGAWHFDVVQQHGTVVLNRGVARFSV